MENLVKDLKYGARMLLQSPAVTVVAVLSLALGIGANSAIFSWVNSLILDPVRVEDADRMVRMYITHPGDFNYGSYSHLDFVDQRQMNEVFSDMMSFRPAPFSFSDGEQTERCVGMMVSGNFHDFLGAEMVLGRTFRPDEDEVPGRDAVAAISYGFWQRRFGGDPDVVGKTMIINGHPFTVIGVVQEGFRIAAIDIPTDVWAPNMMQMQLMPGRNLLESRGNRHLQVVGRLEPGVSLEQAQANMDTVAAQLAEQYPRASGEQGVLLLDFAESMLPPQGRSTIIGMAGVLMVVVGLVLLIACANVANLLLARATGRRHEVSVRLALGASRGRLVRQLLTESIVLAGLAGGAGIVVAVWLTRLILSVEPPIEIPLDIQIGLDSRVVGFTFLATILTGVLFGMAPALQATKPDLVASLKGEATRGSGRSRLRSALVVSQIAFSMVLLVGAGLFLRSMQNAQSIDPGFEMNNVLVATMDPGLQGYEQPQTWEFYRRLVERVEGLPGVRSVALGEMLPFQGFGNQQWGTRIEGYEPGPNERMNIDYNIIGPGYFETMGIPIVEGRELTPEDDENAQGVLIVNESMAGRYWPESSPIGRTVTTMGMERIVVGVARDSKYYTIGEDPMPYMYGPLRQTSETSMTLLVRADGDPLSLAAAVRSEVRGLDPNLPIFEIKALQDQLGNALLLPRLSAVMLGGFGSLALLLASVGLYGVMAYQVTQRTREIGIRIALGAAGGDVRGMVLRNAGFLASIGLAIGLATGLAVSALATSLLYGVGVFDPLAFGGGALTIVLVTLLASYFPALRATRVDPITALRYE